MTLFPVVWLLVVLARVLELTHANRNTRRLLAEGGVEVGRAQYPFIVALHAAWLAALWGLVPAAAPSQGPWLAAFVLLQFGRIWVLAALGRYWTTRIITLPAVPLVRRGPYRLLRHPNYLIVELEIICLPLAFGAAGIAIAFGLANAALLLWRIRVEDRALAMRRRR